MKVLVVGSGGREHAICSAVAKSPLCDRLYCAPGNPGIAELAECWPISADKVMEIAAKAEEQEIDFVIVGPEVPLSLGLVDELVALGIPCFGPSKAAAELESSKSFMKDLCSAAGVPTAAYRRFKDAALARNYVKEQGAPIVVKADGLAAGKGVTVARSVEEAIAAIDAAMVDNVFGASGSEVVIEECMEGEEASFFAIADGKTVKFFASAQDHKAVFDGDKGPNTGGMGAYSPAPIVDQAMIDKVMREIILPTDAAMKKAGRPFTGVYFAGLMITKDGPKLIEFNCRFGDPETEVMLPRLKSDLLALLFACSKGMLDGVDIEFHDYSAVGVVMASNGYPGKYEKGTSIHCLECASSVPNVEVFHAGTKLSSSGEVVSEGGRVLCVTATADTVTEAQKLAYQAVDKIDWPQGFCRRDIAWRAVEREKSAS